MFLSKFFNFSKNLQKFILIIFIFYVSHLYTQDPKLTVIIVIDQFPAFFLEKYKNYLNGGIGLLSINGLKYINAFIPNGIPTTAPGHTMISTGTYANQHGIVNNYWYDKFGNQIDSDDDFNIKNSAVFKSDKIFYDYGKSAKNILADTLSDQLILQSYPHAKNTVFSFSLKSRAAIAMAGKLGKAIWFDAQTGKFTSSKAYFKTMPDWLQKFNKKQEIDKFKPIIWKPFFINSEPYNFLNNDDNLFHKSPSMINKILNWRDKNFVELYKQTPLANEKLINLVKFCIEENLNPNKSERLIIWLSLSSLDIIGHQFGEYSKESMDTIYHFDNQIGSLIDFIYKKIEKEKVLFVLTSDHGIQPIPEILSKTGFDLSRRYIAQDLMDQMNNEIYLKFGIKNLIEHFAEAQFYFNLLIFNNLSKEMKEKIIKEIKIYLLNLPGIKNVWSFDELINASFDENNLGLYLQKQIYKNRSGQIIYLVDPYTLIDYKKGTSHTSLYAYNTNVPLIIYQTGTFEKKIINKNIYLTQLPVTLANILKVPRPSASIANPLPT